MLIQKHFSFRYKDTITKAYTYEGDKVVKVENVDKADQDYTIMKYNTKGKQTESIDYDDGEIARRVLTVYTPLGTADTLKTYSSENNLEYITLFHTPPESDTVIIESYFSSDTSISTLYKDELGNELKRVSTSNILGENTTTYNYEFDEKGNWILKEGSRDGVVRYRWRRKIKYFE